jgi:hypothetical protein
MFLTLGLVVAYRLIFTAALSIKAPNLFSFDREANHSLQRYGTTSKSKGRAWFLGCAFSN